LQSGVCVPGGSRDGERREHLYRYAARPAIASERLSELPDGSIAHHLRRPRSDGTMSIVFEPLVFLEKHAALVPRRAVPATARGVVVAVTRRSPSCQPAGSPQRGGLQSCRKNPDRWLDRSAHGVAS